MRITFTQLFFVIVCYFDYFYFAIFICCALFLIDGDCAYQR